jgi:hypothetical protein
MAEGIRENEREDVSKMLKVPTMHLEIKDETEIKKYLRRIEAMPPGRIISLSVLPLPAISGADSINLKVTIFYRTEEELCQK